jgi:uncharacterized protein YndB with AHSA1/START domain
MLRTTGLIPVPAATVWRVLTDTHTWSKWGPSVRAVEYPTRFIGPNGKGRVQTAVGFWLPFQITDWEEGRAWSWTVAGIPATGHHVRSLTHDSCELNFTVPTWAPFYLPVCAAAIRRISDLASRSTATS